MPLEVSLLGISFKESMYVIKWLQCRCLLVDTGNAWQTISFFSLFSFPVHSKGAIFLLVLSVHECGTADR